MVLFLMGWLSPAFTDLNAPLAATARGTFGGLLCGALGGLVLGLVSAQASRARTVARVLWSSMIALAGGGILLAAHVMGANTSGRYIPNTEWLAIFIHGAAGSIVAVNLVNFYSIPTGLRCIVVSVIASLAGALGYGAAVRVGLEKNQQFIWTRGPFVMVASVLYFATLLFCLFGVRMGEAKLRATLREPHN